MKVNEIIEVIKEACKVCEKCDPCCTGSILKKCIENNKFHLESFAAVKL